MIEACLVSLPLILRALARVVEAAAIVILARRRDAPLALEEERGRGGRLRLRTAFRRRSLAAAHDGAATAPDESADHPGDEAARRRAERPGVAETESCP